MAWWSRRTADTAPAPPSFTAALGRDALDSYGGALDELEGGTVFVESAQPPRVGSRIRVDLALEGETRRELEALVVWTRQARGGQRAGFGARLAEPPAALLDLLRTAAHEARERARSSEHHRRRSVVFDPVTERRRRLKEPAATVEETAPAKDPLEQTAPANAADEKTERTKEAPPAPTNVVPSEPAAPEPVAAPVPEAAPEPRPQPLSDEEVPNAPSSRKAALQVALARLARKQTEPEPERTEPVAVDRRRKRRRKFQPIRSEADDLHEVLAQEDASEILIAPDFDEGGIPTNAELELASAREEILVALAEAGAVEVITEIPGVDEDDDDAPIHIEDDEPEADALVPPDELEEPTVPIRVQREPEETTERVQVERDELEPPREADLPAALDSLLPTPAAPELPPRVAEALARRPITLVQPPEGTAEVRVRFPSKTLYLAYYERYLRDGVVHVPTRLPPRPGTPLHVHLDLPEGGTVTAGAIVILRPPDAPLHGCMARLIDVDRRLSTRFALLAGKLRSGESS